VFFSDGSMSDSRRARLKFPQIYCNHRAARDTLPGVRHRRQSAFRNYFRRIQRQEVSALSCVFDLTVSVLAIGWLARLAWYIAITLSPKALLGNQHATRSELWAWFAFRALFVVPILIVLLSLLRSFGLTARALVRRPRRGPAYLSMPVPQRPDQA
jgi:hypothetical protein